MTPPAAAVEVEMVPGPDGVWAPAPAPSSPGQVRSSSSCAGPVSAEPVSRHSPTEPRPRRGSVSSEGTGEPGRHARPRSRATAAGASDAATAFSSRGAEAAEPCRFCARPATCKVEGALITIYTCAACAPIAQVGGGLFESFFAGR